LGLIFTHFDLPVYETGRFVRGRLSIYETPGNVDKRRMEGHPGSPRRRERVVFETDRHLVVGDVTLPPEGYQSRFSDAVNRADVAFIPLLNVEISPLGGGEATRRDFILLAKEHIRLAYPVDDAS
jgi:hypothetical protein